MDYHANQLEVYKQVVTFYRMKILIIFNIEFDTPYKMFIAAVVLASKFVEDTNTMAHSIYRLVAPLYNAKEINEMERSFLGKKLDFFYLFFFTVFLIIYFFIFNFYANRGCKGKKKYIVLQNDD
jgi:hypothetical protein